MSKYVVSRQTFYERETRKKLLSKYVDKSLVNSATLGTMLTPEGRAIDGTCIVLPMYLNLYLQLYLHLNCTCLSNSTTVTKT